MTIQQQQILFEAIKIKQLEIIKSKQQDYANEDVLSNFKNAGAVCGISPQQNCLSLIATKVARLGELLKGKEPKNEKVGDSIIDLQNYSFLLLCLMQDEILH
jgi:hypothetical protein